MRAPLIRLGVLGALLVGCGARTADGTDGLDYGEDGVESGDPSATPLVPDSSASAPPAPPAPQPTTEPREPSKHRSSAIECDRERPPGNITIDYGGESCSTDADCTEGVNGRCVDRRGPSCTYDECFSDSECTDGGPCGCEMGFWTDSNVCLGGDCQVDADCGEGGYCSPSFGSCGGYSGVVAYWCRTPRDTCVEDSECVDPERGAGYCAYYPEVGYWACQYGQCVG